MRRKGLGLPVKLGALRERSSETQVRSKDPDFAHGTSEKVPHHCGTFCFWSDYDLLVVSFRS
jgi:hypothetical protein